MKEMKWRSYSLLIIALLCVYTVVPTFLGEDASSWLQRIFPEKKVSLGLDLKGGTHLVLGIDTKQVLLENTDRYASSIRETLKDEEISFTSVKRVADTTRIKILYNDKSNRDKLEKILGKQRETFQHIYASDGELVVDIREKLQDYIVDRAVQQTVEAIRNRVDEFGVTEPSIMAQGNERIIVQLPGVKDPSRAKGIIGRTAKLDFKLVMQDEQYSREVLGNLIQEAKKENIEFKEGASYFSYVKDLNKNLKDKLPSDSMILFERKTAEDGSKLMIPYLVEKETKVTGEHLDDAFVRSNEYNIPEVQFRMNTIGGKLFGELTEKNVGKQLAIVLDQNIYSAPVINSRISETGVITLDRSKHPQVLQKEAQDLALVLRAGALPTQMTFEEERTVGPSLGSDSVRKGALSMLVASILVVLFMLFYYRGAGIVSNIALSLNILIILSILVIFEAVLTLPGIAGIILTVGMSVDANVIIFERIREELSLGNNIKAAVESGYSKALSTILDANITTAIAGMVLLQYGTGPVKGFAVTLLIGIVSSVFTAIYASKWIFLWWIAKRNPKKLSI